MARIFGWILMLLGVGVVVLKIIKIGIPLLSNANPLFVIVIGILLIVAGFLFLKEGRTKQKKEVPIYEGEGKNRKIVGYKRV